MATQAKPRRVGIEKIWAYPSSMFLDLDQLAEARGAEPNYASKVLLGKERSVNPTWEDPVTNAVNAAKPMLTEADRANIELLIFGTESSPDQGKPMSTFVFRHLGLQPNCRSFETKHACYGGTAALMMAAHWVASGMAPGKKALVVAADQGRMHLGQPWEYVLGTGAVAMLVSEQPDVLELELGAHGYWTDEVGDTFRPTSTEEAGNTESSVYCYLEALAGAYDCFKGKVGPIDFATHFKHHVYHVPFCAMAYRAHRTLLRQESEQRVRRAAAEEHFDLKVRPSLRYIQRVGGTYTASTFWALIGLIESQPQLQPGDPIGIFAYGSGSCAEFYRARVGDRAHERVAAIDIGQLVDARYQLTVEQYEAVERERTGYIDQATYQPPTEGLDELYQRRYAGAGRLVLKGLDGHFRRYDWS